MLYNILMFFWDNRAWFSMIILALIGGYILGNPKHFDIIFEDGDDYND